MSEVETELALLRTFANTSLRKGSFIYEKVHDLLAQADREKARLAVMAAAQTPSDSITLRVRINITGFNDARTLEIKKGSSLELLKRSIDALTGTGYSAERVLLKRTGKAWGTFDSKSIEQCEMKNNDEIVVDCKNLNENLNPTGLDRIPASGLVPQSTFQFLALTFHAYMLDEGFIAVAELPNAMPGFAPSLKGGVSRKTCIICIIHVSVPDSFFSFFLCVLLTPQNFQKEPFCRTTGMPIPPLCL